MKWFSGVVIFLVFGATNTMAIEEAEYKTVLSDQDFEVRRYESHIIAETIVGGDFEDAGSEAFGQLFKYISGNNTSQRIFASSSRKICCLYKIFGSLE